MDGYVATFDRQGRLTSLLLPADFGVTDWSIEQALITALGTLASEVPDCETVTS